jgi:hypothetical protein
MLAYDLYQRAAWVLLVLAGAVPVCLLLFAFGAILVRKAREDRG